MTLNKIIYGNSLINSRRFIPPKETAKDYKSLREFEEDMENIRKSIKDYTEIKKTINDIEKSIEMYEKLKRNPQIAKDILTPYKKIESSLNYLHQELLYVI